MKIDSELSVGLMEHRDAVEVELHGSFVDAAGRRLDPGCHRFTSEVELKPTDPAAGSFALNDVTIGIGFHWERKERQVFRGAMRILKRDGLTVVNDVPLEEYVSSVISSEMSAGCPIELLKAHAVISRSWLCAPQTGAAANVSIAQWRRDYSLVRQGSAPRLRRLRGRSLPALSGDHESVCPDGCCCGCSDVGRNADVRR